MTIQRSAESCRPGFLLGPLGWLGERLSTTLQNEPALYATLFELEPHAMHLLGIGLAHSSNSEHVMVFAQTPQAIVKQSVGYWPEGLDRLLHTLPPVALSADEYRAIPQLLSDRPTAKFLHHHRTIDGSTISGLFALPVVLRRPAVFKLFGRFERMDRFVHGLRFITSRAGVPFDDLLNGLAALDQTDQIIAKIAELVDNLPLPRTLPPTFVGPFRRIDHVDEIRSLAKGWHNCLADCLQYVNGGTGAMYRTYNTETPAVALVLRFDRLGWALSQIKGPKNVDVETTSKANYEDAFSSAGIPNQVDIAAIRDLVLRIRWGRQLGN
jgi:hypothetical protein